MFGLSKLTAQESSSQVASEYAVAKAYVILEGPSLKTFKLCSNTC